MSTPTSFNFPHPELTPLATDGTIPTHASLVKLHMEVNANAMSIDSNRGSGTHGHLPLTITAAAYATLSATVFVAPTSPGDHPTHPDGATAAVIMENNRRHKLSVAEFKLYTETGKCLKKQLIAAIPPTFIAELSDRTFAFTNVTALELLNHLDLTYGAVTSDDLQHNLETLHQDWSPDSPIEDLWNQIRTCREFAQQEDPISDATAIRAIIQNLTKTGVFTDAIKDWRKLDSATQTMTRLKSDFNFANRERHRNLTTRDAGFAGNAHERERPTRPPNVTNKSKHYCWSPGTR
jgi:hypothetical protein